MAAESSAASVYRCPECGSEQPEPGTCGRCPGTVREADSAAYRCWQCGTTDPLSHDTLCQRALMEGEAEAIEKASFAPGRCDHRYVPIGRNWRGRTIYSCRDCGDRFAAKTVEELARV